MIRSASIRLRSAAFILPILLISGCGTDGMGDLRQFVKNAHADRKPRVEPLPEIQTHETFAYASEDGTDPFASYNLKPTGTAAVSGPRPDLNRRKDPLEEYPLDSLKMVGTLSRGTDVWVVIQAADGTVHRAMVGDHMGQNFGMITKITEEKVELVELIQGPTGQWIERDGSIAIEE